MSRFPADAGAGSRTAFPPYSRADGRGTDRPGGILIMFDRYLTSRMIPLPHILTIELTSFCNLRCVMCPRTAGFVNTPPNRLITREIIDRLDPILGAIDGVDLSGLWGEAFLHPDLYLDILSRLKRRHIGVRTVSNATLITDELAKRLVELGLDCLEVSVDAAREETYRRIRRGGELARVIAALEAVNRSKKIMGRRAPSLRLLFLGMTENISELPEFVGLASRLGAGEVVLQAMGEYEGIKGKSVALNARELGRRWLEEARAQAKRLGVRLTLFPPDQFEERGRLEGERAPADSPAEVKGVGLTKDCFFPWDRAVITTEGEVLPCCASPESFGNLKRSTFREIWYGESYRDLRRALLEGNLTAMCRTCTGQGSKAISGGEKVRMALRLEKNRLRQRLRRSPSLRRLKELLRAPRP